MKKLLYILCGITLYSCTTTESAPATTKDAKVIIWRVDIDSNPAIDKADMGKIQVVYIDSCEYLYTANGSATTMTHKGNCKNCRNHGK